MRGLFGRQRRPAVATPPVVVPESAVRPGEDDYALVRAVAQYVETVRAAGGYALSELDQDALRIYGAHRYLSHAAVGGHAAYLASRPPAALLDLAQEGLDRAVAASHGEIHAELLAWVRANRADAAHVGWTGERHEALEPLDAALREAGGAGPVEPLLAGQAAALDVLEVVRRTDYGARIAELCAANSRGGMASRDLAIERHADRLSSPLEAAIGIILSRTRRKVEPFTLTPNGLGRRDDGATSTEWSVATGTDLFLAISYTDRVVVAHEDVEGEKLTALGHLAHDKADIAVKWAERGQVALAAMLGLEELGISDRLEAIVFERRKTLKTGDAAAFHLALRGTPDLALVVFPGASAVVDPHSNERLAEFTHDTLAREAEAHAGRLAELNS